MKREIVLTIIILFAALLVLSQFSACALVNKAESAPNTYWDEYSSGRIETNDVPRLQKKVPFSIILPEYLPDGSQSYKLVMNFYYIKQIPNLSITYYSLKSARQIDINEGPPQDPIPRPLPPGLFAQMNPDYTPMELAGVEVLENKGVGEVVRSDQTIQVSAFLYAWEQKNLHFSGRILGYDQTEARKIIESMLK